MGDVLRIENLGQIREAEIELGDLTVFVGPQASGKSITLQLLKLLVDMDPVKAELRQHGIDWGGQVQDFFDVYFGEGMRTLWKEDASRVIWNKRVIRMPSLLRREPRRKHQSMFYIPAQRALTLRNGWPRPFTDYSAGDPFVVRHFSEILRHLMEGKEFIASDRVFPPVYGHKHVVPELLNAAIFRDFTLRIDKHLSQKRLVLSEHNGNGGLPFMVWSAGQREFIPLLLAFYWLMPPLDTRWGKWVVIEEPEMGLHTHAITTVLLMILGLLECGYKVCVSTHSPYVLDLVWALRTIKKCKAPIDLVREVFDAPKRAEIDEIAKSALKKNAKVYYFDRENGYARDISDLDPGSTDQIEAGWGGLSEFSGRVADVVAKAVAEGE